MEYLLIFTIIVSCITCTMCILFSNKTTFTLMFGEGNCLSEQGPENCPKPAQYFSNISCLMSSFTIILIISNIIFGIGRLVI